MSRCKRVVVKMGFSIRFSFRDGISFSRGRDNHSARRERMQRDHDAYKRRKREQYERHRDWCERRTWEYEAYCQRELKREAKALAERRKVENKVYFDQRIHELELQRNEKQKLYEDVKSLLETWNQNKAAHQQGLRASSFSTHILDLQKSVGILEAYLQYLDEYKKQLEGKYNWSGEILEPFSFFLPENYPCEGNVLRLKPSAFEKEVDPQGRTWYNYTLNSPISDARPVRLSLEVSDTKLFESLESDTEQTFMYVLQKNKSNANATGKKKIDRWKLSLAKGIMKQAIAEKTKIEVTVVNPVGKFITFGMNGTEYPRMKAAKDSLIEPNRRHAKGTSMHLYLQDYNFTLTGPVKDSSPYMILTEKFHEALAIDQFDVVSMVFSLENQQKLHDHLSRNGWLNEDDEWRFAPIWDNEKNLVGLVMQKGNCYAIKAYFEEHSKGGAYLRYDSYLENQDFLRYDDIFVATNIQVSAIPETSLSNHLSYLDECNKFYLFLNTEFTEQEYLKKESPMILFLQQWEELTRRFIESEKQGEAISLDISKTFNDGGKCILITEKSRKFSKFLRNHNQRGKPRFWVETEQKGTKRLSACQAYIKGDDIYRLEIWGRIPESYFENNGNRITLFLDGTPYTEVKQLEAYSQFREKKVASKAIHSCVLTPNQHGFVKQELKVTELFNTNIHQNRAQLDTVVRAMGAKEFFVIQGPPGTGKTTVIKEMIMQQLAHLPTSKILVVSQANVAVDNVLRGIVPECEKHSFLDPKQIVRFGDPEKMDESIQEYSFQHKFAQYQTELKNTIPSSARVARLREKWLHLIDCSENKDALQEYLLHSFQIIGATCVGLANARFGLSHLEFDLVIIDEAGKAKPGELLIPINRGKKVILIGDHKQLPPVIEPKFFEDNKKGSITTSDIIEEQTFFSSSFFEVMYESAPVEMKSMLNVQFRMPPDIANLVNVFYGNQLGTGDNCYQKTPLFFNHALFFIDMTGDSEYQENNDRGFSPFNYKEIDVTLRLIEKIRQNYRGRIVVITPYKGQKGKMIRKVREQQLSNVRVDTVDSFQGDEEDVVIYCTTRAKYFSPHLGDMARLNVAFSRSRNTLFFIGSSDYLSSYRRKDSSHIMLTVLEHLQNAGKVIPYAHFAHEKFSLIPSEEIKSFHYASQPNYFSLEECYLGQRKSTENNVITVVKQRCKKCGSVLDECETEGYCLTCLQSLIETRCTCCREIIYSLGNDVYLLGKEPSKLCENCTDVKCTECGQLKQEKKSYLQSVANKKQNYFCRDCSKKMKEIVERRACISCGKEIPIELGFKRKIEQGIFSYPKRCSNCKIKR